MALGIKRNGVAKMAAQKARRRSHQAWRKHQLAQLSINVSHRHRGGISEESVIANGGV